MCFFIDEVISLPCFFIVGLSNVELYHMTVEGPDLSGLWSTIL